MCFVPKQGRGLFCPLIDIIRFIFRIHDFLAVIQSDVPRKHIAERDRQQKIRHAVISEQLKTNQKLRNQTVCHTAENADHTNCRAK